MAAIKIHQFFKRYQSDTVAFVMLVQILVIILAGLAAWIIWQYAGLDPLSSFIMCLGGLLILQVLFVPIVVAIVSRPLKVLSQAIAHVSKDPVQTPPPDITSHRFERNGLKAMVQTVYELAVSAYGHTKSADGQKPTGELYKTLLNNVPVGIIALDKNAHVIITNPQAPAHENMSGEQEIELLFEQNNNLGTWLQEVQANKVRDTKVWHRVADRTPGEDGRRIFDVIGYYNKEGQQGIEIILITVDRTNEYAPGEEDMDFIALAAHELRGPITVIRGYLDLIGDELQGKLEPDQHELIDRLQVSAEQLSGYINNILNVSRYDRHHLRLHLREDSLFNMVKTLVPDLALRAKTKKRRLTFHIAEDLPTIAADRSSVGEVISNLIDNAIKYSHEDGEVLVSAEVKGNFVETTVQDFGIGMPGSVVGNLFSKFYRSHRSRQQVSGTGLGLYICKAVVESHGGSIWVRSTEGQGSTFGFTLPIYSTVADKLGKGDNGNEQIIERSDGWIKNHAMFRR
jgi:two-component system phosphate regulon sensor histidine kinase PhoR/two-component system sensor histidine kinase VicK